MKLRVPDYYFDFHCIADRCRHSCCIGWEIDLDEDTCEYYKLVPGDFGDSLRKHICTEDGENYFELGKGDRCPFLNAKNLCEICIELGEEALSEVCTEYPRFSLEYGDVLEKCLALSCEEVGRLVFEEDRPLVIREMELQGEYEADCPPADPEESVTDFPPVCPEKCETVARLEQARNKILEILQDRSMELEERIDKCLIYAGSLQNEPAQTALLIQCSRAGFAARMSLLHKMEVLDSEWENYRNHMEEMILPWEEEQYQAYHRKRQAALGARDYEREALLTYFAFRYLLKAVYDKKFYERMEFSVLCFRIVEDMDLVRFLDRKGDYTLADRIDVARIFSRETEHSEENLELLLEEL